MSRKPQPHHNGAIDKLLATVVRKRTVAGVELHIRPMAIDDILAIHDQDGGIGVKETWRIVADCVCKPDGSDLDEADRNKLKRLGPERLRQVVDEVASVTGISEDAQDDLGKK